MHTRVSWIENILDVCCCSCFCPCVSAGVCGCDALRGKRCKFRLQSGQDSQSRHVQRWYNANISTKYFAAQNCKCLAHKNVTNVSHWKPISLQHSETSTIFNGRITPARFVGATIQINWDSTVLNTKIFYSREFCLRREIAPRTDFRPSALSIVQTWTQN
jgi:hypothetical protein